jgi:hypothetical protein
MEAALHHLIHCREAAEKGSAEWHAACEASANSLTGTRG